MYKLRLVHFLLLPFPNPDQQVISCNRNQGCQLTSDREPDIYPGAAQKRIKFQTNWVVLKPYYHLVQSWNINYLTSYHQAPNNPFHSCQENGRCSLKCRLKQVLPLPRQQPIYSLHNFSNVQPTAVLGVHASPSVCSPVLSTQTIESVRMCHQTLFGRVSTQQPC